jgi:3-isopropylmalate dehydrogenase
MEGNVRSYLVAHLPGDGIGPEVTAVARDLVDQTGKRHGFTIDWRHCPLGSEHYLRTGEVLPDEILSDLRKTDAIFLGAVGSPSVPPGVLERGLLLPSASSSTFTSTSVRPSSAPESTLSAPTT